MKGARYLILEPASNDLLPSARPCLPGMLFYYDYTNELIHWLDQRLQDPVTSQKADSKAIKIILWIAVMQLHFKILGSDNYLWTFVVINLHFLYLFYSIGSWTTWNITWSMKNRTVSPGKAIPHASTAIGSIPTPFSYSATLRVHTLLMIFLVSDSLNEFDYLFIREP